MIFSKKEEEMLLEIFKIYAPSRKEEPIIEYIENFLKENSIPYTKDDNGNIFNLSYENTPLLSAHMDSVGDSNDGYINDFVNIFDYRSDRILRGMGNIGGDDKCGIFVILRKLLINKKINFIFSIGEEVGCIGINQVIPKNDIKSIPYGLVIDRRGFGDIICLQNSYGNKEFEDALSEVGKDFGFVPAHGLCSDANAISKYINCANLSSGYHNPHGKKEFVSLVQLRNTADYIDEVFKKFADKKFENPKPVEEKKYNSSKAYNDDFYSDYDYKYGKGKGAQYDFYKDKFYCPICKAYVENKHKVILSKKTDLICDACAKRIREQIPS